MSEVATKAGASAEAIQTHYDVGNRFYQLWLDPTLTYSCALWDAADETLETAQRRKLDYFAAPALAGGGQRVLDIGCGWGGMLRRLREGGAAEAVGLTLSQEQLEHVQGLGLAGVEARLESWRDHRPSAPYDAIVSIGAFEHFADEDLDAAGRMEVYRDFFAACHGWLKPGGFLGLQTIAYGPVVGRRGREHFTDFFPESDAPRGWEVSQASDGHFETLDLRNDREHYVRTLKAWRRNLHDHWDAAVAEVGETKVAWWERYLVISAAAFQARHLVLQRHRMRRAP